MKLVDQNRPDHLLVQVWGPSKHVLPDVCIKRKGYNVNHSNSITQLMSQLIWDVFPYYSLSMHGIFRGQYISFNVVIIVPFNTSYQGKKV